VYIPTNRADSVAESGKPANETEGVKAAGMQDGRAVFEVASGSYRFTSEEERDQQTPEQLGRLGRGFLGGFLFPAAGLVGHPLAELVDVVLVHNLDAEEYLAASAHRDSHRVAPLEVAEDLHRFVAEPE